MTSSISWSLILTLPTMHDWDVRRCTKMFLYHPPSIIVSSIFYEEAREPNSLLTLKFIDSPPHLIDSWYRDMIYLWIFGVVIGHRTSNDVSDHHFENTHFRLIHEKSIFERSRSKYQDQVQGSNYLRGRSHQGAPRNIYLKTWLPLYKFIL